MPPESAERRRGGRTALVVAVLGVLAVWCGEALALARVFRFDHLGVDQGLPSGVVQALLQDRVGFLWIGTRGGLCRYDGRETLPVPLERSGEPRRRMIRALAEDGEGHLWVGTGGDGLVRRDRRSGELSVFGRGLPGGLGGDRIFSLLMDARGVLWVGTEEGLFRYDRALGVFEAFPRPGKDASGLPAAPVRALCEDVRGRFWAGTDEGLCLVDRSSGAMRIFRHIPTDPRSLARNDVRALCPDGDGALWVGTGGAGLDRLDAAGSFLPTTWEEAPCEPCAATAGGTPGWAPGRGGFFGTTGKRGASRGSAIHRGDRTAWEETR